VDTASETSCEVYLDLHGERSSSGNKSSELSVNRRSLLKTGGGLSLVGILVSALTQSSDPANNIATVHSVGPNEEYETIQAAYDALDATGGQIAVRHDYDSAAESFPVEMNQTDGYHIHRMSIQPPTERGSQRMQQPWRTSRLGRRRELWIYVR